MLTFRSLHNIDIATNLVATKSIPGDFSAFIDDYLSFAENNENNKRYTIRDSTTQVMTCIRDILSIALTNQNTDENLKEMASRAKSIANRLFNSERDAQERIIQMNKRIKKGSLVQALIEDTAASDSYLFIVAKVEHSEYFDGDSLKRSFGFTSEKKNVWKSAVIPIYFSEGDICFGSIRIFTDNEASYWSKDFLELDEEKSDETNTKCAFESMDRELKRMLVKNHPRDYYILRNSIIKTLRTPQIINYTNYVDQLIDGYEPEDNEINTAVLKERLLRLPEKHHFDTQFTTVPKAVTAKVKVKFETMVGITINIDCSMENYKDVITAGLDENQRRILKVRCLNEETYRAFGG